MCLPLYHTFYFFTFYHHDLMYFRIEDRMAKDLKLSVYELLIYGVIYSSQNQTYIRGQSYLGEITWISIATLKRSLKNMLEKGLIKKVSHWYQIVSQWYPKVSEWYFTEDIEKYQSDTWKYQTDTKKVSEWATYINTTNTENNKKEIKEKSSTRTERVKTSKSDIPSVSEILAEFKKYTWITNEQALESIRTRLEYKQWSKHKYKSIKWAITQIQKVLWLLGEKDRVKKLEFCVNNSIANNWQWLGWYDSSEREFYAWLKQEQKIQKAKELEQVEEIEWITYWADTIDSIINQVVEEQISKGIIQEFNS